MLVINGVNCWNPLRAMNTTAQASNRDCDSLKRLWIGQSAAKYPSDGMKVQRIVYTVFKNWDIINVPQLEKMMKDHECAAAKVCKVCNIEKNIAEFDCLKSKGKIYLKGKCKVCTKQVLDAWRKANPERYRAQKVRSYTRQKNGTQSTLNSFSHTDKIEAFNRESVFNKIDENGIKKCSRCREDKHFSLFVNRTPKTPFGEIVRQPCLECNKKLMAVYREENKDSIRLFQKLYRESDYGAAKKNMYGSKRRKIIKERTPKWANLDKILETYLLARELKMHVDHVIPLQGTLVSGLHVENNLRIIPAIDNLSKGNRLVEDICCS